MITARVSKNLKGTIMLPSVGPKAFIANNVVYFNDDLLYAADIQGALSKRLLIMVEGPSQSNVKMTKVTNLSFGSVSLPQVGVLRAGKSMDVRSDLLDTPVYRKLEKDKVIAIDLKLKTGKTKVKDIANADIKTLKNKQMMEDEEIDPSVPANMQKGRPITVKLGTDKNGNALAETVRGEIPKSQKAAAKKGTPDKQKKHGVRRAQEDSLLIDPNAQDIEEEADFLIDPRTGKKVAGDDGIIFVDHEQAQARMNPRLKGR